jgi:hypothetical protein
LERKVWKGFFGLGIGIGSGDEDISVAYSMKIGLCVRGNKHRSEREL